DGLGRGLGLGCGTARGSGCGRTSSSVDFPTEPASELEPEPVCRFFTRARFRARRSTSSPSPLRARFRARSSPPTPRPTEVLMTSNRSAAVTWLAVALLLHAPGLAPLA